MTSCVDRFFSRFEPVSQGLASLAACSYMTGRCFGEGGVNCPYNPDGIRKVREQGPVGASRCPKSAH